MERRHQVFISSTYTDLISERNEIMQALLELECMPAGMEIFPAANDSQWEWIKKVIDESDYYIVIVAGRYGTVSKDTGLSYTEMEYRYALESKKPVIGFLHEDPSNIPTKLTETNVQKRKKLETFRELVGSKLCKHYSSPTDLGAKVSRSITQLKKQYPASGWIRATILESLTSSDEVLKLKNENEALKEKLYNLGLERPKEVDTLANGQDPFEVEFTFTRYKWNEETSRFRKFASSQDFTILNWDEMFSVLGPEFLRPGDYGPDTRGVLNSLIEQKATPALESKYAGEQFDGFEIEYDCLNTILHQFRALKALTINTKGDWELTPYGDNYLTSLIGVAKGKTRKTLSA